MRHIEGKPDIIYPCRWEFRIIGQSQERLTAIIQELVQKPYNLAIKNHSSKGRFVSMHLDVEVVDEAERNSIYSALSSHPEVKMVL